MRHCVEKKEINIETKKEINPSISGLNATFLLEFVYSWVEERNMESRAQIVQQFALAKCKSCEFCSYSKHKLNSVQEISGFVFGLGLRNEKQWEVSQGWN